MLRSLSTIIVVAAISGWISYGERGAGDAAYATDWVRTADGWEPRRVLEPFEATAPPAVHPAVIAAFQLVASAFFLAAFPARVNAISRPLLRTTRPPHLHSAVQVAAAG